MLVWATDEVTGETALKEVVQLFRNETNEWIHVTVECEEGFTVEYTYNADGIRTSKTFMNEFDGEYSKSVYLLDGTRIVGETLYGYYDSDDIDEEEYWYLIGNIVYLYDEAGSPIGMAYREVTNAEGVYEYFFFEKNLQGDIIAVYNAIGTKLVTYKYDAWGAVTTTYQNGGVSTNVVYNPFRYRGYYYDTETGLYYLQSRYYNPNWGRFINADGQLNNDMLGSNMFSYCSNNPVMRVDYDGHGWWIPACAIVGCIVGAVSKILTNIATGEDWNDGVLGAAAGGAMYGGVLAATGSVAAAGFASAATESFVNEVVSYIPEVSKMNGTEQKDLNLNNVTSSIATVIVDTVVNGAVYTITGEIAAAIVPTNNGWFIPQKFISSFLENMP